MRTNKLVWIGLAAIIFLVVVVSINVIQKKPPQTTREANAVAAAKIKKSVPTVDGDTIAETLKQVQLRYEASLEENKALKIGERISTDISSINHISYGGAKFWLLIQDEFTGYIWSYFLSAKSELAETVMKWMKTFQQEKELLVQFIRLDNSGENKALQRELEKYSEFKRKDEGVRGRQNPSCRYHQAEFPGFARDRDFKSARCPLHLCSGAIRKHTRIAGSSRTGT